MLNTYGDIKNDVIVQLGISTSVAFYTDTILGNWIDKAHKWAAGWKKWTVTEGRVSTTYVGGTEEWNYPEGWKPDSIRLLQVGGKRFKKTNFYQYQTFREDYSTNQEKVFSDFARLYYINPNTDAGGTLTVWGQYTPIDIDQSDPTVKTVFSDTAEEANSAIVEEVLAYAKIKEKKLQESIAHHEKAKQILLEELQQVQEEQFGYQDTKNSEGMFGRIDVVRGDLYNDLVKRNQWY